MKDPNLIIDHREFINRLPSLSEEDRLKNTKSIYLDKEYIERDYDNLEEENWKIYKNEYLENKDMKLTYPYSSYKNRNQKKYIIMVVFIRYRKSRYYSRLINNLFYS